MNLKKTEGKKRRREFLKKRHRKIIKQRRENIEYTKVKCVERINKMDGYKESNKQTVIV